MNKLTSCFALSLSVLPLSLRDSFNSRRKCVCVCVVLTLRESRTTSDLQKADVIFGKSLFLFWLICQCGEGGAYDLCSVGVCGWRMLWLSVTLQDPSYWVFWHLTAVFMRRWVVLLSGCLTWLLWWNLLCGRLTSDHHDGIFSVDVWVSWWNLLLTE